MEDMLSSVLETGEEVLWRGKPEAFESLDKTHKSAIIKGEIIKLVVSIAVIIAYIVAVNGNGAGIKPAIIVIILAIMAYALASPFLHINTLRRKVEYVITNQRLITIKDEAKGVEFDKIKVAEIKTDADGHTTLLCGPSSVKSDATKWRTDATLGVRLDTETLDCDGLTWYAIPNAKEAEVILKKYLPIK